MSQHAGKLEQVRALLGHKPEQARAMCQRLVQTAPRDPYVNHVMSQVFLRMGLTAQSLHFAARAAELGPGDAGLQVEHARLLGIENRHAQAAEVLRLVRSAHPSHAGAVVELAITLEQMELHGEAEKVCREGLERWPGDEGLLSVLSGALLNLGRPTEAAALAHGAAARHPASTTLASGLALMMNYVPRATPAEVFAAHRRYGELVDRVVPVPARVYTNVRDPAKRLRVGIVSPDLRQHSVAYFIEPWLREADFGAIEFYVYQTNRVADGVTARLRSLVEGKGRDTELKTTRWHGDTDLRKGQWHIADNISDAGLAEKICADGVDVLMELSGHTHAHSLAALAARPAPVQVTYLGYPNTTGLSGMDFRIVDSHTDPAGSDAFTTEKLLRLDPCFLCYQPPEAAPDPAPPPCLTNGFVTFGSFNTVQKVNEEVLRVWAAVLAATPGSRLLLKGGHADDHGLREGLLARIAAAGVEAGRVEFLSRTKGIREHLELYGRVDIALDPFPYNGTTTTCEALYMGVPVVTLAGAMHAGRVGVSLLSCIGEASLIAGDEGGYVDLAAEWGADMARLTSLRAGLRPRLLASALCDGAAFARRMEAAVRQAWSSWCAETSP